MNNHTVPQHVKLPSISDLLQQDPLPQPNNFPPTGHPTTTFTPPPIHFASPNATAAEITPMGKKRSSSTSDSTTSKNPKSSANVSLRKRQRKKFEDVQRLYFCDFPSCNKGYGSLTHLNEHRVIQKHGPRKKIDDFKHVKMLQEKLNSQKKKEPTSPPMVSSSSSTSSPPSSQVHQQEPQPIASLASKSLSGPVITPSYSHQNPVVPVPQPPAHSLPRIPIPAMPHSGGITNLSNFITSSGGSPSGLSLQTSPHQIQPPKIVLPPVIPPSPSQRQHDVFTREDQVIQSLLKMKNESA